MGKFALCYREETKHGANCKVDRQGSVFSFGCLCLTNGNSGYFFCLTFSLSLLFLFIIYSEMLSNSVVEVKVKILRLLKQCNEQLF